MITIRKINSSEAQLISDLAMRSKAHWGYDNEFMAACVDELSYSAEQIINDDFRYYLAEENGSLLGFYMLNNLANETVLLEALFVEPSHIGKGVGRRLLKHAIQTAKRCGAAALEAQSDPYAEPFYVAMGATITGRKESGSIPGRLLPMINIQLNSAE